jgi:alpha-tubulin suppressor-like RCC1 family protein
LNFTNIIDLNQEGAIDKTGGYYDFYERMYYKDFQLSNFFCHDNRFLVHFNKSVSVRGRNFNGELGLGNITFETPVIKINPNLQNIIKFECGRSHSLALNISGAYSFGNNKVIIKINNMSMVSIFYHKGQLGIGNFENQYLPVKIHTNFEVVDVFAFSDSSFLLNKNGKVFAFGRCMVIFVFQKGKILL